MSEIAEALCYAGILLAMLALINVADKKAQPVEAPDDRIFQAVKDYDNDVQDNS